MGRELVPTAILATQGRTRCTRNDEAGPYILNESSRGPPRLHGETERGKLPDDGPVTKPSPQPLAQRTRSDDRPPY